MWTCQAAPVSYVQIWGGLQLTSSIIWLKQLVSAMGSWIGKKSLRLNASTWSNIRSNYISSLCLYKPDPFLNNPQFHPFDQKEHNVQQISQSTLSGPVFFPCCFWFSALHWDSDGLGYSWGHSGVFKGPQCLARHDPARPSPVKAAKCWYSNLLLSSDFGKWS